MIKQAFWLKLSCIKYVSFLISDLDYKISAFNKIEEYFRTLDQNLRLFKALKFSFQIQNFLRPCRYPVLNILCPSSKPWETITFWMIWSIFRTQNSMLHGLFIIGVNGKTSGGKHENWRKKKTQLKYWRPETFII